VSSWLLFTLLLVSSLLTVLLYLLSVRPEAWSRRIGPRAYPLSGRLRTAAIVCMYLGLGCFLLLYYFPHLSPFPILPLPWSYWISALAALALAVPAGFFLVRGVTDAGEEAAVPDRKTRLFGGIYRQVRHPQAWEGLIWLVLALMLNSSFHTLYALLWLVLEYIMVMAEEKDLRLRFGEEYERYKRQTPAFFPRLRRR
jgi:protein-S-isoprenylcysteine O-methyltransferase Ste14